MIDEHKLMQRMVDKIVDKKLELTSFLGSTDLSGKLKELVKSALDYALFAVRDAIDEIQKEDEDAK